MKRTASNLLVICVLSAFCIAVSGCKGGGTPYDEYEILPLDEAPEAPEAPAADASIAAEERDAAVEEEQKESVKADEADRSVCNAQVHLSTKSLHVGETLTADIRLAASDAAGDGSSIFYTYLDGQEYVSEGGRVHFEKTCNTPGTYYLQGVIYVETPTGTEKYPYSESYTVE